MKGFLGEKKRYLALSLYWMYVNAMFNSELGSEVLALPNANMALLVHMVSILGGAVGFALIIAFGWRGQGARAASASAGADGAGAGRDERAGGPSILADMRALLNGGHAGARGRGMLIASALFASATSLACYAVHAGPWLVVLCAFCSGLPFAFILVAWAGCYTHLESRELVGCTACAFLISGLAGFACEAIGPIAELVVVTAAPLALALLVPVVQADAPAAVRAHTAASGIAPSAFAKALATVGVFIFSTGVLRVASGGFTVQDDTQGRLVLQAVSCAAQTSLMLLVMVCALRGGHGGIRLSLLYKGAIVLTVGVIAMVLGFAPQINPVMLNVGALITSGAVELCIWVLLVDVAKRASWPTCSVVASGRLVVHAALGLGTLVALAQTQVQPGLLVLCVVLLVIDGLFLLDTNAPVALFDIDIAPEQFQEDAPSTLSQDVQANMAGFAETWKLSPREAEVFALWITSHGLKQIEAALNLSEPTVKTHVRHIYAKCGVHSRRELVELVEEQAAGGR